MGAFTALQQSARSLIAFIRLVRILTSTFWWGIWIFRAARFDKNEAYVRELVYGWARKVLAICKVAVGIRAERSVFLSNGPFIFMANRQSLLDIPVLAFVLRSFSISWAIESWLTLVPFLGWVLRRLDPILVRPGDGPEDGAAMRLARERLSKGESIVVFPEARRSSGGNLHPFRNDFFRLAAESNTPVVPISIRGTRHILPPGTWRIQSVMVQVWIGSPLWPDGFAAEDLKETVSGAIACGLRVLCGAVVK